jgi:sugar/nucleoside kinase (ribokinase family)
MPLLVTGSIGIDTVKTPLGESVNCLGGSAVYFSMAASYFVPVRFVGVVGADCPFNLKEVFAGREVDLAGLEVRPQSKTFRWKGSYIGGMEEAMTDDVQLNVLLERPPVVPEAFRDSRVVFLANTAPALQMELLSQVAEPQFVAADTMNCWIEGKKEDLMKLLQKIDMLVLNNGEARLLTGEYNPVRSAKKILAMGPKFVIIKKGEFGSMIVDKAGDIFILPGYPVEDVKDPTGAGDGFAGAIMGYIASHKGPVTLQSLKKAVAYGTVLASFTIEDFSLGRLSTVTKRDIEQRFETLKKVTQL